MCILIRSSASKIWVPDAGAAITQAQITGAGGGLRPTTGAITTGIVTGITEVIIAAVDLAAPGVFSFQAQDVAGNPIGNPLIGLAMTDFPASPFDQMNIVNGGISDATFTMPADPTGPVNAILSMIVQTWRRFFKKVVKDGTTIKTYKNDGTTVVTTSTYTSVAGTDTINAAT